MEDHREAIGDIEAFWRREGDAPVLYVHGVPNHSEMWLPFLERSGGIAPDLPGFGQSDKPALFDYTIDGYATWLEKFIDRAGLDRFRLVVHDWGVVALAAAQRMPERVEKLVVIAGVPLLPGYEWHRVARIWRTPFAGEMFQGLSTKFAARRLMPPQMVDEVWKHFDHGTQRAILKLYRSADPPVLARAGERLGDLRAESLVITPGEDIYIGREFGAAYAEALGAEQRVIEGASHWPWFDEAGVVDDVAAFIA